MAARLPIVATAVGGNPELVREGETAFSCPAATRARWPGSWRSCSSSRRSRARWASAGGGASSRSCRFERMADGHGALYRRVLGRAPTPAGQRAVRAA